MKQRKADLQNTPAVQALHEALCIELFEMASVMGKVDVQLSQFAGPYEMSVELCSDEHIAELNKEWRGKAGPTDVLSFETDSPPGYPYHLLGDIVISTDTAERQAKERG